MRISLLSGGDDGDKLGLQGGAADEEAVDVGLVSEVGGVLAVGAAAVQDPDGVGELAELGLEVVSDLAVDVLRVGGCGRQAGADCPDRLVRNDNVLPVVLLHRLDHCGKLSLAHVEGAAGLLLVDGLADAENHLEALLDGKRHLVGDKLVRLVEDASALAVSENDPLRATVLHLDRRDLSRVRPGLLGVAVLRTHLDRLLLVELCGVRQVRGWWTEHHLDVCRELAGVEVLHDSLDGLLRAVHLEVTSDEKSSSHCVCVCVCVCVGM